MSMRKGFPGGVRSVRWKGAHAGQYGEVGGAWVVRWWRMWYSVVRRREVQWRGQGRKLEGGPCTCGVLLGAVGEKPELYIMGSIGVGAQG